MDQASCREHSVSLGILWIAPLVRLTNMHTMIQQCHESLPESRCEQQGLQLPRLTYRPSMHSKCDLGCFERTAGCFCGNI